MTELVFILDRSGSMSGLEADTIGGFNAMIEKQKREPGPALVSTVLFSNESEELGLPEHLGSAGLLQALNLLMTREEFQHRYGELR